jgi:hypothetical protein
MPRTAARRLPLLLFAFAPLACASWFTARLEPPSGARLEDAWRLYQISEEAKAMAIAIDETGTRRAWGIRYGYLSQESANRGALEECAANAKRAGITADCHMLAVGDRRPPGAVRACADGRATRSFCDLMNTLVPPDPAP